MSTRYICLPALKQDIALHKSH